MSNNTDLALFEEIKHNLIPVDKAEYAVPMTKVFGQGSLAKTESFGNRSLAENTLMVDQALQKTSELQNVWNRSHSQWMWKHINLSYHSPEKNMRQIAAEINGKKNALNEAKWKQVRNEIKIRKIEEEIGQGNLDYWKEVDLKVKLLELKENMATGTAYIEGAMKDVLALTDLYEQLQENMGEFTEEELENRESKAHLKRSVVQCIRDVRQSGSITKGEQEYLEQIGVNPSRMLHTIRAYVQKEASSNSWDNSELHTFVDALVTELIDVAKVDKVRMESMGFKHEVTPGISYSKPINAGLLEKPKE
jgi:hypothetical protein